MANSARNWQADADRAVRDLQKDFEKRIDAIGTELKERGPEAAEGLVVARKENALLRSYSQRISA